MLDTLRRPMKRGLSRIEGGFDRVFGPTWNPWRQLGTMSFFFYWIAAVSGIYVYILFDTSVNGAFDSVEYMTHHQWYLGGVMRSFHRYASDAMVVTTLLHLMREFILNRYQDVRWYAWLTGIPILWFLYMSGVSGYWLVWDSLAQHIAVTSMHWLDWLGIFGEPVATNFLTRGSLTDRFFTLLVFIHIFVPLGLLFLMWIHLIRVNRARYNPPRGVVIGSLVMLTLLALIHPAVSHVRADLGVVPGVLSLDWFYLVGYPLYDAWGAGPLWVVAVGSSLVLSALPWLPPRPKPVMPAQVTLDHCNGCGRCFNDCPFSAISMVPRTDGRAVAIQPKVDPDMCSGCGMCMGACNTSIPFRRGEDLLTGIDRPNLPFRELKARTVEAMARLRSVGREGRVIVFGCDHGVDPMALEEKGVAAIRLPCTGMLPPSFIEFALSGEDAVDGVLLTGCRRNDCFHRWGDRWTEERIAGLREPWLKDRVPRMRVRVFWGGDGDGEALREALAGFRTALEANPAGSLPAVATDAVE
ncbi:MAG: hydrogenase iron-sulfur subunit [Alphaproteobacteria bacterium]